MPRNIDMTALRSFVTVAESGGVTRAAGILNLTQSAVSMQLKRLEDSLDLNLLDRSARTIGLTPAGEQLLAMGRRMLEVNDEIYSRLTATEFEGELKLGVPHDIIYPAVPQILKRFAADFPRMKVRLISGATRKLLAMFARGESDLILTTEESCGTGGRILVELPLLWIGAVGGTAWRKRPLPVAFCSNCIFRGGVLADLNSAGVPWEMSVDSEMDNAVEAAVSADLGVHVSLDGNLPRHTEFIQHGGALPKLRSQKINLYVQRPDDAVIAAMSVIIEQEYRDLAILPRANVA